MPISIECILESAVFFPGDTIFCRVFISNLSSGNNSNSNGQDISKQTLSWITAQVYGNLTVESSFIKLSSSNKSSNSKKKSKQQQQSSSSSSQDTSSIDIKKKNLLQSNKKIIAGVSTATSLPNLAELGENSKPIFTSPTTFLASDLYIAPGQTKSYIYYLTLPSPLPPSFKGTSLKYSYYLSIAAQIFTNSAQILTVPIRVLTPASALRPIKYKSNMVFDFEEGSAETTQEYSSSASSISKNSDIVSKQWPVSPFKKSQYFPLPYPQNVSQYDSNNTKKSVIDILNKHSSPVSIVISKGQDKIATFSICKTAFSLGDSVHGTFDFSVATIPCYKILIKLECEETVDSKYLQSTRGSNKPIRKLYGELHEFTTNLKQTHFMFHIPVEANQEFSTKYVSVKWSLRFEFVTPIKSQFTPYQPPIIHNSNNNNNNNNNNPILITSSNISTSLPNTPNMSPLKNKNTQITNSRLDESSNSTNSNNNNNNNNNNNIPKSKSFEINHHSRNSSFDHNYQPQLQQSYQHSIHHQRNSTNENISYGNDDDDEDYETVRKANSGKRLDDNNSNDDGSSHSENTIINDDTLSNSSSSNFSSSTNNSRLHISSTPLSASGSFTNQNQNNINNNNSNNSNNQNHSISKKKRMFAHPNIGILKDDGTTPLADTLHWSLPIRVLVGFPPHELLHTNKNELIL